MTVPMLKIGAVLSTMAMVTNWMSQTLPSLAGLNATLGSPDGTHQRIISGLHPGAGEAWQVFSSDPDGRCVCTVLAPSRDLCRREPRGPHLRLLVEQVQNVSQSMEVVDLRTSRDLQYVRDSEPLLRGVAGRVHTLVSNPGALSSRGLRELRGQMTQLRPLLAVVAQYRLELRALASLRQELLHLSVSLTALQEEAGPRGDEEALQRRLLLLETRLRGCIHQLGCGRLTAIGEPRTVRTAGSRFGSWMTDAMMPSADGRVWSMDGFSKGRRVLEFRSMEDFCRGQNFVQHLLPQAWTGTGHVVYNGSLYYNKHGSDVLVRYHLRSRSLLLQRRLSGAGYNNTFPYSWGGGSDIDLMADELGLWAVYTSVANGGNILVSRLDPLSLDVLRSWDTGFPKRRAGEAFMICGTLYVTDSHLSGAKVHFAFHTDSSSYEYSDVHFHNQYAHISMLDYNPRHRALYAWNNGHQVLYDVTLSHQVPEPAALQ
ncbi:noelin-2-like isoform X2 [Synchiropus splendidus]|uniref:noelin-2-like isoform X2 n=1 Tax=Synchiropus splendidus TaxID=270530 RepID=UPI00237ED29F|nr:noelin-2-like isoform X2 [Synchiropus splendidus]